MPSIDELFDILERLGERQYDREPVSQLEHALQAATLAERDVAGPTQVTAALLHDIHLVDDRGAPASDAEASCTPTSMISLRRRFACAANTSPRSTRSC